MKEQNNKDKKIFSPMRTLLKLTFSANNLKNHLLEKEKKQPSSIIFNFKNNHLNKVSSAENFNENKYNTKMLPKEQTNYEYLDIKNNQIYNYYNSNFNNTFYNINMINENNSYNNFSHSVKDIKKKKVSSLSNNNINKNKDTNQEIIQIHKKTINNEIKIIKKINIKQINQKKKNEPLKNNKTKYRFNNNKNYPIDIYGTIGNINSKINKNNKKTNIMKINNKNVEQTQKSKNSPKKAIQEIEMPFTNQKKKYYCVYENNINKIKSNNNQPNISLNKNINTINYDLMDESLNRETFLMNSQNLGNTNNPVIPTQNRIFNLKQQNINGVNNILINSKDMQTNMIYSPKRGISHVYSQDKIKYKEKNHINTATDIRIKNNSVKKIEDFTYNRKNISYKKRIDFNNENSLLDNISSNILKKNYFSNIDNCNLMTNKEDNNDLDECQYNIKPEIYPEIKINLRY